MTCVAGKLVFGDKKFSAVLLDFSVSMYRPGFSRVLKGEN